MGYRTRIFGDSAIVLFLCGLGHLALMGTVSDQGPRAFAAVMLINFILATIGFAIAAGGRSEERIRHLCRVHHAVWASLLLMVASGFLSISAWILLGLWLAIAAVCGLMLAGLHGRWRREPKEHGQVSDVQLANTESTTK